MSSIVAVRDKFKAVALNLSTIKTFSFDDLDESINAANIDYRLFHLSVPADTTIPDFDLNYQNWPIECWLFEIDDQSNSESRVLLWDSLEEKMNEFMKKLLEDPGQIRLAPKSVNVQRGHYAHQDSLIGVRYAFTIAVFECK